MCQQFDIVDKIITLSHDAFVISQWCVKSALIQLCGNFKWSLLTDQEVKQNLNSVLSFLFNNPQTLLASFLLTSAGSRKFFNHVVVSNRPCGAKIIVLAVGVATNNCRVCRLVGAVGHRHRWSGGRLWDRGGGEWWGKLVLEPPSIRTRFQGFCRLKLHSGDVFFPFLSQVSDLVIILNQRRAIEAFTKGGNLTLGGNLTVAVGPVGRSAFWRFLLSKWATLA